MANLILFGSGKFRKCFPEGREVKDRVIAESTRSPRSLQDFSVGAIGDDGQGASAFR